MVTVLLSLVVSQNDPVEGGVAGQYFVISPTNMTVRSGEPTRLQCMVGNKVGHCQWTRDGFALGADTEMPDFPRYSMSGAGDDECDLMIDPVLPIDEGVYQCQVGGGAGSGPISTSPVSLSVNSPPGQPHIIQGQKADQLEVDQGEVVELECESYGGKPAPQIDWVDGTGNKILSDVTQHVSKIGETGLFRTSSALRLKLEMPKVIICIAQSDAFPTKKVSR